MALLGQARLAGRGWFRSGKPGSGLAGMVWNGEARLVESGLGAERLGWRVMLRLGAVLCGSVMSGLVWLAR